MRFKEGEKVVIINHESLKGEVGYINSERLAENDTSILLYTLRPNKQQFYTGLNPFAGKYFQENDLLLVVEIDQRSTSQPLDFSNYLTESQMRIIAEKIYEEQLTKWVDNVLRSRKDFNGTITDQILYATAATYVKKLSEKFEEDFLRRCKEEIHRDTPVTKDESTFRQGLVYELQQAGKKYIEANLQSIQSEMKNQIHSQAKDVVAEGFTSEISRKIDVKKILREILLDDPGIIE